MIRADGATPVDARRWRDLADRAVEPNVYLDPRWLLTSVREHRDAADLRLLLVEDDDDLRGLFAFTLERAWSDAPFQAVSTAGTFLRTHAERHHPLIDPADPTGVLEAMLGALPSAGAGLAVLRKMPGDGPLADAFASAAARRGIPVIENIRRPAAYAAAADAEDPGATAPSSPDPDFDLPHASTRSRKRTRAYVRALERDAGELQLQDRSADAAFADDFLALQMAGWKGDADRGGLAMGLDAMTERWFSRIVDAFRADGDVCGLELRGGDTTVYSTVSLRSGGMWAGFLDTYDDAYARHSAGTLGRIVEINHLRRVSPHEPFDPNLDPYYAASTNLYPDRRDRVDLILAPGGATSRLLLKLMPRARALRDAIRSRSA